MPCKPLCRSACCYQFYLRPHFQIPSAFGLGRTQEVDEVKEKALKATDTALDNLHYYKDVNELKMYLPALVHPSHAVLIVVEAPTSKARVILSMLEEAEIIRKSFSTDKVCVLIPCGTRICHASTVYNKCELLWSLSIMGACRPLFVFQQR
jgi:hypothetical protein